jgi:quercetin dioxygenase-like cupin family protein
MDSGRQAIGLAILSEGSSRLVHRHGAHRSAVPSDRAAWHTHPFGQTLIVTFGRGWVQHEGGTIQEIHPGDVVWFEPGERHWHGASPTTAMQHIAINEALDGKAVDWMEHVTDEEYLLGANRG